MQLPIRRYRKSRYIIPEKFKIPVQDFYLHETYLNKFVDVEITNKPIEVVTLPPEANIPSQTNSINQE
jgi:hypothetical protein